VNVFLPANVHKRDLHQIHMMAWKKGVKSLYYCRSLSIQRADAISEKVVGQSDVMTAHKDEAQPSLNLVSPQANSTNYEECLACQ
jgi:ribonucleoside-diphosphate reductase alpha chain